MHNHLDLKKHFEYNSNKLNILTKAMMRKSTTAMSFYREPQLLKRGKE